MATAIRLTVLTGPHKNHRVCFCAPNRCEVGRDLSCFIQLSGTERDQLISRHHCLLDINPPAIQVEDLGSSNGTYINGCRVARIPKEAVGETVGFAVKHGDVLTVGGTTLRVDLVDCPHAGEDSAGKSTWEAGETAKKDCLLSC
jgi:predicted component of type VI protein secretion system